MESIDTFKYRGQPMVDDDISIGKLPPEWDKVFQIASGKAGEALGIAVAGPAGAELGEAIGAAIWRSIMGNPEDPEEEFRREVLARLDRIESKLGEILKFLQQDFPDICRVATSEALVIETIKELVGARIEVAGWVTRIKETKGKLSSAEFGMALTAANKTFQLGIKLLHGGQEWYTSIVHAYTAGLSLYGHLLRYRPGYHNFLVGYVQDFHEFANACMKYSLPEDFWMYPPPKETFAMAQRRIADEIQWSAGVLERVRKGRVTYLLATNGPAMAYGGWFETANNGEGFNGNYTFWYPFGGEEPPKSRDELIKKVTSLGWEIPSFRAVYEVADSPRRDPYAETLGQLWSALSMEKRNMTAEPTAKQAKMAIAALNESALKILGSR
jgi:hypothetical protein